MNAATNPEKKMHTTEGSTEPETKKRKRPRGRPRIPEVQKAKEQTWFRSTAAEKLRWKRAARRAGISLRSWIRLRLNEAATMQEQREHAPDAPEAG